MGNSPDQNQDFIKQMLAEKKNFILSFRGHSFSLDRNIPSDIFGNSECNVLFIPGSCGSAHSVPDYIASNPRSNLAFIGNTSTGRGQVTNTIIDALILEHQKQIQGATRQDYSTILQDSSSTIEKQGGNIGSLKAASLGEHLLAYVYSQR
jgi:hypothetical protein